MPFAAKCVHARGSQLIINRNGVTESQADLVVVPSLRDRHQNSLKKQHISLISGVPKDDMYWGL